MNHLLFFLSTVLLVGVEGQTYLDVNLCIGPLTAAPNCDLYASKLEECNAFRGSAAASCYCPQTVFNAIAGCEGEFRLCFGDNSFDNEFTGSTGLYNLWHSACDATITYKPTTPAISSLSATYDTEVCNTVQQACHRFGFATNDCSQSYTVSESISSCWCQSSILSLASVCQVDGTMSCLLSTPITTDLFSYKYCNGKTIATPEVSTAAMTSTAATTSQAAASPQGSATITSAPGAPPSIPPLGTSTSSSTSSDGVGRATYSSLWYLLLVTGICALLLS